MTYNLSEFRDSLEAVAMMFDLNPIFPKGEFITSGFSDAKNQRKRRDVVRVNTSARNILKATEENLRYVFVVTEQDV